MAKNNKFKNLLKKLDCNYEKSSEDEISQSIEALISRDKSIETGNELYAESLAFRFQEDREYTGQNNYFIPMISLKNDDDTITETPSIKEVTQETINYWTERVDETQNPIMKARYSGLVLDFSKTVTDSQAPFATAEIHVESLLEIANKGIHIYEMDIINKLRRALILSIKLNNQELIEKVRNTIISYEEKIAEDDKVGTWAFSYDLLVDNKKSNLTKEQKEKIINNLEERLERLSTLGKGDKLNPFAPEEAALRLASYYQKTSMKADIERVIIKYCKAFEKAYESASAIQVSEWLRRVHSICLQYGLKEKADQIAVKLRKSDLKAVSEMKPSSQSIEISHDEMKQYVEAMIAGNLEEALYRVTSRHIPRKDDAENQLADRSKKYPLQDLFPKKTLDHKGRILATIGSVEHDLESNVIQQISQYDMGCLSPYFLRKVMESLIEKFSLSQNLFLDYLYKSPIFQEENNGIIKRGLRAYFEADYLVAVHLLIPQIEAVIRNFIEICGGAVYKKARNGGYHLKTFDELLREEIIKDVLGEDIALYFRVLFTDQRGWNLRNNICHGIIQSEMLLNPAAADRVIHALLCLSMVRKKQA